MKLTKLEEGIQLQSDIEEVKRKLNYFSRKDAMDYLNIYFLDKEFHTIDRSRLMSAMINAGEVFLNLELIRLMKEFEEL